MPEFEEFSRANSIDRDVPQFSLQARGSLTFNHAAFLALGEPEAVVLLYDANDGAVALRKEDSSNPNAHMVRRHGKARSYNVAAQAFVTHYAIPILKARRFAGREFREGVWGFLLRDGQQISNRRGAREAGAATTANWRHTSNGFDVPGLMRIGNVAFSHPAYLREISDEPPSIRVGVLVACEPLPASLSTSELRSAFLDFIARPEVMSFVSEVSYIDPHALWTSWGGHGRINFEAALAIGDDKSKPPTASAMLLLPEAGMSHFGRDPRYAELIVHIEPRGSRNVPAEPASLRSWYERFVSAFNIPAALTRFLTQDLRLTTSDEPPAQFGISLKGSRSMVELVDTEDIPMLPGSSASSWFMGWALGDQSGQSGSEIALDFMRQMCDYTLHLDKYEPALTALDR